jgi:hypothetical protein
MDELWQAIAAGASPDFDALVEALVDSIGLVALGRRRRAHAQVEPNEARVPLERS